MSHFDIIKNRKIRLGIVGCGRVSQKHFDALEQHQDNMELVSVCDQIKERADQAAVRMKSKAYTDIEEMLKKEKLDIVTVATPNGHHSHHVKLIADHNVHVITEKPMAIDLKDGLDMQSYCEKKKVLLCVIYQNRFNDTSQAIWRALKEGRFGKIYLMSSNIFWMRPQSYYEKAGDWHGSKALDGGAFYTQVSHYIDFMNWIARDTVRNVYANLKTLERNIETEDTGVVTIEWNNNILASISMTMLTYPENLEGSVTILGEKGTVKIGGVAMNKIEHWDFADTSSYDKEVMSNNYKTACVYGFGHVRYYDNIIKSFRGVEKPFITADEGIKSLVLLEAIKQSNAKGLPLNIKDI